MYLWLEEDIERGGGWLGSNCGWAEWSGEVEEVVLDGGHDCGFMGTLRIGGCMGLRGSWRGSKYRTSSSLRR